MLTGCGFLSFWAGPIIIGSTLQVHGIGSTSTGIFHLPVFICAGYHLLLITSEQSQMASFLLR